MFPSYLNDIFVFPLNLLLILIAEGLLINFDCVLSSPHCLCVQLDVKYPDENDLIGFVSCQHVDAFVLWLVKMMSSVSPRPPHPECLAGARTLDQTPLTMPSESSSGNEEGASDYSL